jgi:hypothetical protein
MAQQACPAPAGSSWGDPSGLLQALARTTAGAADAYAAGGLHLSVVVEAAGGSCSSRTQPASGTGSAWCLQLGSGWHGRPAEPAAQLDARLQAVLEAAGASQPGHYILFVLPEEAAAAAAQQQQHRPQPGSGQLTVGRFRHAWMQLPAAAPPDAAAVAAAADQLLRACFALGSGPDAAEAAARLPLSAAAHAVLSFSLLVADPESGVAAWDFGQLAGSYLQPVVRALAPVASLAIDSQVREAAAWFQLARRQDCHTPALGGMLPGLAAHVQAHRRRRSRQRARLHAPAPPRNSPAIACPPARCCTTRRRA